MAQRLAAAWVALALACATPPTPESDEAIDWTAAAAPWSIQLVTLDPDGASRTTRMRIVVVDGAGVVRTGESRWGQNLERDPGCHLQQAGADHPLRAEVVASAAEKQRIDAAFLDKYGWQERLFQVLWSGEVHYFRLRAAKPGGGVRR